VTAATWHRITSEQPADRAHVIVRNGRGERPARWDGKAREWWMNTPELDWRASAACYPEWCEAGRGQQKQESRQEVLL